MWKVGVCLNKKEIIQNVIENNGGIAKTSDFADKGINKYEVAAFCKEGVIERIRRGFYQLPLKAYYIQKNFLTIGKSTNQKKVGEVINFACNFSVRRSFS